MADFKLSKKKILQLLSKADKHFNDRNFDSAQDLYNQILQMKPGHIAASSKIEKNKLAKNSYKNLREARELLLKNKHSAALKKIRYAIKAYPENYEAVNLEKETEALLINESKR